MVEQFSNDAETRLTAAITTTSRPIAFDVDATLLSKFPAGPDFRVKIEDEILKITAGGSGGSSWTGTNVEGTLAALHPVDASVVHVLTAGAINDSLVKRSDVDVITAAMIEDGTITGAKLAANTITLIDANGEVILTPAGFGEAWEDYIVLGLYNAVFSNSDVTNDESPYWTKSNGTFALDCIADSTGPGGFKWRYPATGDDSVVSYLESDFAPVTGFFPYNLAVIVDNPGGLGTRPVNIKVEIRWFDNTQAFISSGFYDFDPSLYVAGKHLQDGPSTGTTATVVYAPVNAHYAKARLTFSSGAGAGGTTNIDIFGVQLSRLTPGGDFLKFGPYYRIDIAAGLSASPLNLTPASITSREQPGKSGYIVGMTARISTMPTAGGLLAIRLRPHINADVTSRELVWEADDPGQLYRSEIWDGSLTSTDAFTAGNLLGMNITTNASLAPTTLDIEAWMYVIFNKV